MQDVGRTWKSCVNPDDLHKLFSSFPPFPHVIPLESSHYPPPPPFTLASDEQLMALNSLENLA